VHGLDEYSNKERNQVADNTLLNNEDEAVNSEMKKAEEAAGNIVYSGFIAQEVEEAAKKLNFEFSGIDKPQSKDGVYGLRYDNFVVPLVKAVQELSQQNDELKSEIRNLKSEMKELKEIMDMRQSTTNLSSAALEQNIPNPFTNSTTIHYTLPRKSEKAQIIITDKSGNTIKRFNVSGAGKDSVNVSAFGLINGTYNYSLIVDGKIIGSKQMVLQN